MDVSTNAQKDMTCMDPGADLSLVMYNTDTKNDQNSNETEEEE